jgi:hypothetical protein
LTGSVMKLLLANWHDRAYRPREIYLGGLGKLRGGLNGFPDKGRAKASRGSRSGSCWLRSGTLGHSLLIRRGGSSDLAICQAAYYSHQLRRFHGLRQMILKT